MVSSNARSPSENSPTSSGRPTPKLARGISTTPEEDRNDANNLVLICPNDHAAIDRKQLGDVMTVELVKGLKQRHERRIRQATELASSKDTVIVRLVGDVAGTAVELTRERTGAARWLPVTDSRPIRSHTTRPASKWTCETSRTPAATPTSRPHAR